MLIPKKIKYQHHWTPEGIEEALKKYREADIFSADFETASLTTKADKDRVNKYISDNRDMPIGEFKKLEHILKRSGLDHPSRVQLTHCSMALSEDEADVFILLSPECQKIVLDFLVSTDVKQVWHNASFDFRLIYFHTGLMPKNYEDTQIFARIMTNNADDQEGKTGLKEIAGRIYGDWAVSPENFEIDQAFNDKVIHYAGIDACATMWVWNKLLNGTADEDTPVRHTFEDYSPWEQLLTAGIPKEEVFSRAHFYHNTAKFLVRDTVRVMMNGIHLNMDKVSKLEAKLDADLQEIKDALLVEPVVKQVLDNAHQQLLEAKILGYEEKKKTALDFPYVFKNKNIEDRNWYMDVFCERVGIPKAERWPVTTIRKLVPTYPPLAALLEGTVSPDSPTAIEAMRRKSEARAEKHNNGQDAKIEAVTVPYPEFKTKSTNQVRDIFDSLGMESESFSDKTGLPSWNREELDRLVKSSTCETTVRIAQLLVDDSYASIVRNNFINNFYRFSIDEVLYGFYRLLGAKSG